ncbi:tRNA preQ1(34) S-adenosylmethionine ribosyltransferase-isomerase QueA [Chloroflexota bacterium]
MRTSDFDFCLPPELIAQTPIEPRDQSRLMVVNRGDDSLQHRRFFEMVDVLQAGDVLVLNDSRVILARLMGKRSDSGDRLEILLLRQLAPDAWETLVGGSKRVRVGTRIEITDDSASEERNPRIMAEVIEIGEGGKRTICFPNGVVPPELGNIPLPPYIHVPLKNPERYQTVYASIDGSVAAPTAGLHFTPELIDRLKGKGVHCLFATLHVGLDTFRPVRVDNVAEHPIHQEYGILSLEAASQLSQAKREGRRVICVGTTTVRLVEAVARMGDPRHMQPFAGWVDLFILPGHQFRVVDALITNFHVPRSTVLMLVAAFAGKNLIDKAYHEAIAQRYHFYSFGDSMLIL